MLAWVTLVYFIANWHFVLCQVTMYSYHSKQLHSNSFMVYLWPMSFYYNLPKLLYPTVFVHSLNMSKPTPGDLIRRLPSLSHYTPTVPPSWHCSPALPSPLLSLARSHYHREQHSWYMPTCLCAVKRPLK